LRRRALTDAEVENVRFAFQMLRGTLNNTLINQPGPLPLEDPAFRMQVERAFGLVSGIVSGPRPAARRKRRG
jgi:hypothetical protein